jgi:Domain found in Dishevelled, Egl-10, and Pleckstrin (DEP)
MKKSGQEFVALMLVEPAEERLWIDALATQEVLAAGLGLPAGGLDALLGDSRLMSATAMVADAPLLEKRGIAPADFAGAMHERYPDIAVFIRLPARAGILAVEQAWATGRGIASLLPGSTVAAWRESFAPVLRRVLEGLGVSIDEKPLGACLNRLVKRGDEPRLGPVKETYADAYRLEMEGVNAARILEGMRGPGGVAVGDRGYRGTTYRECFVASEAVEWIMSAYELRRPVAAAVCSFLWRTGRIHHVVRDAAFADGHLYFRFSGTRAELERIDFARLEADMRSESGVPVADRTYLAKTYARCFVGSDAVQWLMSRYRLSLGAAEDAGQRLLELGVFHHVVDQHGFTEGKFFYRFRSDEVALAA